MQHFSLAWRGCLRDPVNTSLSLNYGLARPGMTNLCVSSFPISICACALVGGFWFVFCLFLCVLNISSSQHVCVCVWYVSIYIYVMYIFIYLFPAKKNPTLPFVWLTVTWVFFIFSYPLKRLWRDFSLLFFPFSVVVIVPVYGFFMRHIWFTSQEKTAFSEFLCPQLGFLFPFWRNSHQPQSRPTSPATQHVAFSKKIH